MLSKGGAIGGLVLGIALGAALRARRRHRHFSFHGRSVVITGGSRGLGLVMARQLAGEGARLAIFARDGEELKRAEDELSGMGAEVFTMRCDVRYQDQVNDAIAQAAIRFGGIDVLINNAGIIQVGPLEHMTVRDFEEAMAVHLFGPLYTILAALPHLRRRGGGRIVNISSVGGKIAIPHLLPYTASKFALTGLSEGLRAELSRENILVTTVCPGLMRTGSPRNAQFKGRHRDEYAWFIVSDSLPLLSVSAERAGRQILKACRHGSAQLIIGAHTRAAVLLNELFPGAAAALLSQANRLLPAPVAEEAAESHPGHQSQSKWAPSWLTRLSEQAALRNNERLA